MGGSGCKAQGAVHSGYYGQALQRRRRPSLGATIVLQVNPAVLSADLGPLFPDGAVVAELRGSGETRLLLPAEAGFLGRSVPKRAQEFAAGRLCARRALAELGIIDIPIEMAADRRPLWPAAVVGSITHTDEFCAAVVAERSILAAVGIDSEDAARVKPELWKSICVAEEIDWLASLPEAERAAGAALIFSAKEAFYKCQYPLTEQFLGFRDAHVQATGWGEARGRFRIAATRDIAFTAHTALPMEGDYLFHEQLVTAAICLAAS
jgi:4'-phosphopantetheinyl transferase EntD